jgi:hypothetical protein
MCPETHLAAKPRPARGLVLGRRPSRQVSTDAHRFRVQAVLFETYGFGPKSREKPPARRPEVATAVAVRYDSSVMISLIPTHMRSVVSAALLVVAVFAVHVGTARAAIRSADSIRTCDHAPRRAARPPVNSNSGDPLCDAGIHMAAVADGAMLGGPPNCCHAMRRRHSARKGQGDDAADDTEDMDDEGDAPPPQRADTSEKPAPATTRVGRHARCRCAGSLTARGCPINSVCTLQAVHVRLQI